MNISIKHTNIESSPRMNEMIEEKVSGLAKYRADILEVRVEVGLTSRHHQKGDIYRAELTVVIPGHSLRAEAETDSIQKSIVAVKNKIKTDFNKLKGH